MTAFRKRFKFLAFAITLFLFSYLNVYAGSVTVGYDGATSVIVGSEITIKLYVSNISSDVSGGISTIGGNLVFDNSYLQYISGSGVNTPFSTIIYESNDYKVAGLPNGNSFTNKTTLFTFKFKALKTGSTAISFKNPLLGDENGDKVTANVVSKSITITPPPSTNTNLSSLAISNGTINFNKDVTNYSVKVGSDVASINVTASVEDSGAKVSGIGTKSLNYGNNVINVIVTAPSGNKKNYTINVNREDTRSSNNNLSRLKVSSGILNPSFSASKTTYAVSVPFEVSSIKVEATAEDSKSKVAISGGASLKAGAVTNVTIKVTAENGLVKTYIVKVTRGKDPKLQDKKNTNNNLASITPEEGTLTPKFSKDTINYILEVPYSVGNIELNPIAEDEAFATVKVEGNTNLKVGENEVKIVVTAEDDSIKEYIVKVTRLEGTEEEIAAEKNDIIPLEEVQHLLASIKITNGKLTQKFDSKRFVYYYKKNKDFKIEGIPKDNEDKVAVFEQNGVITIVVGDSIDEANIYTFIPKKDNKEAIAITSCATIFIGSGSFFGYKLRIKNKDKISKQIKVK